MKPINSLFALLSVILLPFVASSQSYDAKVTTAVVNYDSQQYDEALKNANIAVENISSLKAKNVPKAWYYKGMSLFQVYLKAARDRDEDKMNKYPDAILTVYDALRNCISSDKDGKFNRKLKDDMPQVYNYATNVGLTYMNATDYSSALKYLNAADYCAEHYYQKGWSLVLDLRGQTNLALKDSSQAYIDLTKSIELNKQYPPEQPDILSAYTYYRIALIDRYMNDNINSALEWIQNGLEFVNQTNEKVQANRVLYSEESLYAFQEQYNYALQDLKTFELDVYLNYPEKRAEALNKFKAAIDENPNDNTIRVSYASLLETSNQSEAEVQYKKVLESEPNNTIALFNLGALYMNNGADYAKQANLSDDYEEADRFTEKMKDEFRKSLPYFEKFHELNPTDRQALSVLKQITLNLELMEDYQRFKQIESELD